MTRNKFNDAVKSNSAFMRSLQWKDICLVSVLVASFVALADWKSRYPNQLNWLEQDNIDHLGGEYNQIARSIVHGKGFSSPFQSETGPTAWMPPVLPFLIACLYWIFREPQSPMLFMSTLSILSVWFVGLVTISTARSLRMVGVGYVVFIVGVMANFGPLFQVTDDTGLLLMLITVMYVALSKIDLKQGFKTQLGFGVFGGICALSSPTLGGVWAIICFGMLWPRNYQSVRSRRRLASERIEKNVYRSFQPLLIVGLIAFVAILPWTIRNRLHFGEWIPIKSNAMYELWQSQCNDDDGVLDLESLKNHPCHSRGLQHARYLEMGETAFISEKGNEAINAILRSPFSYLQRMVNRFLAATIFPPSWSMYNSQTENVWISFLKKMVFPVPFVFAIVLMVSQCSRRVKNGARIAIAIYALYLVPYVMISYYDRYAIPLLGIKMLMVIFGINCLGTHLRCLKMQ